MRTRQTVDPAQVVLWARIYDGVALALNVLMGALYGAGGGIMLAMPGFFGSATSQSQAPPPQMRQVFSIEAAVFIGLAVLAVIVSFAAFLPPLIGLRPGRRLYWGWQIGALVVGVLSGIGFGVLGCVGLVGAVVLMVYWFRPEVREYVTGDAPAFGM